MSRAGLANRHLRNRPARGAHLREWSLREPCSSAQGGAGACSLLANHTARSCGTKAGGATIAFLESDRRDLPGADERIGDIRRPREGRPRRRRGARSRGGPPAARRVTDAAPATALRPEGPCSARVRRCRDWSDTGSETARGVGAAPLLAGFARVARTERTELRGECSRSLCAKQDGGQRLADAHGRTKQVRLGVESTESGSLVMLLPLAGASCLFVRREVSAQPSARAAVVRTPGAGLRSGPGGL